MWRPHEGASFLLWSDFILDMRDFFPRDLWEGTVAGPLDMRSGREKTVVMRAGLYSVVVVLF